METQPSKIGVPWGSYINFQPTKRRAKPSPLATNCSKAQRKENAQPSERIFRVMKTHAHGDWTHHVPTSSQCHIKQGKIVKVCQFMLIHVLSMAAWHMPLLCQPELRPSLPKLWKCLLELQSLYQVVHRLRGNLHGMPWLFPRGTTSEEDTFCSKS